MNNPGPGSYQSPSEFGQYDGDIYSLLKNHKKVNTERAQTDKKQHK